MGDSDDDFADLTSWCDAMTSPATAPSSSIAPVQVPCWWPLVPVSVDEYNEGNSEFSVPEASDPKPDELVQSSVGGEASFVADQAETTDHQVGHEGMNSQETQTFSKGEIYELYQPHVVKPLKNIRNARGHQVRPLLLGSTCSGLCPESRFGQLLDLDIHHAFTNDIKASAYRFAQQNGPFAPHHYADMVELADNMHVEGNKVMFKAKCVHHEQVCEQVFDQGELDCITCGSSCKAFSMARHGRLSEGSKTHKDEPMIAKWCEMLARSEPKTGLLENVAGFMLPESSSDPASPLKRLVQYLGEIAPQYTVVPVILQGSTFMVFSRRRVYVCAIHESVGGPIAAAKMKWMLTEPPCVSL